MSDAFVWSLWAVLNITLMAPRRELVDNNTVTALGVIAPLPIHVESPKFEGSLATLFRCVKDHKVHLLDVPLSPVCEAYFTYLIQATIDNLDEAAAALTVLAYLLERKAWALLPSAEPEPEAEEPLELPASGAHEYGLAIEALTMWQEERSKAYFRSPESGPDVYELPYSLGDVKPEDLVRAFTRLLEKATLHPEANVAKSRRSLSDQMVVVLKAVTAAWTYLEDLIEPPFSREDAVYFFLALLELVRLGQVGIRTNEESVQFARARR